METRLNATTSRCYLLRASENVINTHSRSIYVYTVLLNAVYFCPGFYLRCGKNFIRRFFFHNHMVSWKISIILFSFQESHARNMWKSDYICAFIDILYKTIEVLKSLGVRLLYGWIDVYWKESNLVLKVIFPTSAKPTLS